MEGLTVGRMVHYVKNYHDGRGIKHLAAIVVDVLDSKGSVALCIFPPQGGIMPIEDCGFDDQDRNHIGTWHWIEKA